MSVSEVSAGHRLSRLLEQLQTHGRNPTPTAGEAIRVNVVMKGMRYVCGVCERGEPLNQPKDTRTPKSTRDERMTLEKDPGRLQYVEILA